MWVLFFLWLHQHGVARTLILMEKPKDPHKTIADRLADLRRHYMRGVPGACEACPYFQHEFELAIQDRAIYHDEITRRRRVNKLVEFIRQWRGHHTVCEEVGRCAVEESYTSAPSPDVNE